MSSSSIRLYRSEVRRCYSICSAPGNLPTVQVLVKRVNGGMASPFLVDDLPLGATIHAQSPRGAFVLGASHPQSDQPQLHIFIGAGSGLAPLLPMIDQALARNDSVLLLSCHRSPEEEVLREEVEAIVKGCAQEGPPLRFQWRRHFSSHTGRIEQEELTIYVRSAAKRVHGSSDQQIFQLQFYICGPKAWMGLVRRAVLSMGVPAAHIGEESFASAESGFNFERAGFSPERHNVTLELRKGHTQCVTVAPGQTILDASEAAAVSIPAACRSGNCGSCRATIRAGQVLDMEDGILAEPGLCVRTCRVTPINEHVILSISSP